MFCAKFGWIGQVILEKKMKMWKVYRHADGQTAEDRRSKFLSSKDALLLVWLKLAMSFWRKSSLKVINVLSLFHFFTPWIFLENHLQDYIKAYNISGKPLTRLHIKALDISGKPLTRLHQGVRAGIFLQLPLLLVVSFPVHINGVAVQDTSLLLTE